MATDLRSGGVVSFSSSNALDHGGNAGGEAHPKTLEADGERITPRVIQVGTIGEFLGWVAPQDLVQGSEEGLAQRWETQWQEVLKAVQPLPGECGIPPQPKPLPWDLCEVVAGDAPWSNGEVVTQVVVDSGPTFPGPDVGPNRTAVKEVVVGGEDPLGTEAQRRRFRQFHYKAAVGPREVCKRLRERCCRWLMPEKRTKEQILDLLVLEQFLTILPPEMQHWVRNHRPQTCSQAVALAEDFLRARHQQQQEQHQQQQQVKVLGPCEEVVVVSPETDWTPMGARLSRPVHGEAQLDKVQELRPSGDIRCLDAFALSSSETTANGNEMETSHHPQGVSELPMLLGTLPGQSGLLGSSHGLGPRENGLEPVDRWEEATLCSEGVYETVVRLEEHGHWCLECGESFLDAFQLAMHQKTQHSGRKRPECPECGKSFRDLSHVLRHQTVHTGEKPYACSECGQSFTQKPALNRHLRKHSEDKDFPGFEITIKPPRNHHTGGRKRPECLECGKSFRDVSQVLRHQTVHTGERPYSCLECGQSFTQKPALNRHKRKHLEIKPYLGDGEAGVSLENSYQAPAASKDIASVFSNTDNLDHWSLRNENFKPVVGVAAGSRNVTKNTSRRGQKNHWCFVCLKGFRDKADVVRHERIHTGEKPYTCLVCGKRFSYTSSLYKHQETHQQPDEPQRDQSKEEDFDCGENHLPNVRVAEGGGCGASGDGAKVKVENCEEKAQTGPSLLSVGNLAER